MKKLVLTAVLSSLFSLTVHAQNGSYFVTQQALADGLKYGSSHATKEYYKGYILGVVDKLQEDGVVCVPPGTHSLQIFEYVSRSFDYVASIGHPGAAWRIRSTLVVNFPCRGGN
jgi:hypothetical protein